MTGQDARWPCPCCGYLVFSEPPGSYEICSVCGWEDDLSQLRFASAGGGANGLSLLEAQAEFAKRERRETGGQAKEGYARDPGWRPLDPDTDGIEISKPGKDYGRSYAGDSTAYYYWRQADPQEWRLDINQTCVDLYLELKRRPRPLDRREAAMLVDLVDAWRALEHRKHIALVHAVERAGRAQP